MAVVKRNRGTIQADAYVLRPAGELFVGEDTPKTPLPIKEYANMDLDGDGFPSESGDEPGTKSGDVPEPEEDEEEEPSPETDPLGFARIQADALLRDARQEAEDYVAAYKQQAIAEFESELEKQKFRAQQEGYNAGYAAGMTAAMAEAKVERNKLAAEQIRAVTDFLEAAARTRDRLFDENREEMKNLAMAIAEKVIQVSLKNSSDILLRMVDAATDTHKRCEWAHIYVADCDVKGKAFTTPELTAALSHISDRVRVIPMADDESGTCIVELPDAILDASVSTQLANIREVLDSVGTDDDSPTVFYTGKAPKNSV
ncbi:MAG: F0F1 ATP synthase subunit delta [Oscillospiraceae bacterium]|nr:F0F1 ATP synthase subunit delta [Oscillospiraceae bacterium]